MRGLTFRMADGLYALRLADALQVLPLVALRPLVGADEAMAGLLNLHGRVVPVVDLARACTGRPEPVSVCSRIVLMAGLPALGVVLDTTGETVPVPAQGLEPCPVDLGHLSFLAGVSSHRGQLLQWLDAAALRPSLAARVRALAHA